MNPETVAPVAQSPADRVSEWQTIKGQFKIRFGRFSNRDIDNFNGNTDLISEKMQSTYGYTKDRAEQEYRNFRKSLPAPAADSKAATGSLS
jgi:uncharacterized protein YjbJ (UPF0337 family)